MSPAGSEEGLTLLAQGREAEIFVRPDGKVVKVMRFADWGHRVEREQAALQVLHADGLAAPESFGTTIVDGRPGLVMERIEGADFLQLLGRRPYALNRVARTLATQHVAMHRCAAPAALPELRAVLRERIAVGPEGPAGSRRLRPRGARHAARRRPPLSRGHASRQHPRLVGRARRHRLG